MLRWRSTVVHLWLIGAAGGTLLPGCGAGGEEHRPAKAPVPVASVVTSAAVASVAPTSAEPPAPLPPPPEAPVQPTAEEIASALLSIPADPAPAKITLDTHYLVSNEDNPQAFREAVSGRGGVYVGVGAEQSFLFGGWSRADLLFLVDFDEWVVDINEVHGLLFEHARSPAELLELWGAGHAKEVEGWIGERSPDAATTARRLRVFEKGRPKVEYRLKWLRTRLTSMQVPFFGNDQAEFEHVAGLWRGKKVRCVRADLTASGTLRAFGDLARRAGWVVRTLYMSNAEFYFPYDAGGFKDNLRALPFDERSIIVHTHPSSSAQYLYVWQEAQSYLPWIGRVRSFGHLLQDAQMPELAKAGTKAWQIKPPPAESLPQRSEAASASEAAQRKP